MLAAPYYQDASITLHHGDALDVLRTIPDCSVDCCVTSPPYFNLRDYGHVNQIGWKRGPSLVSSDISNGTLDF